MCMDIYKYIKELHVLEINLPALLTRMSKNCRPIKEANKFIADVQQTAEESYV